MTCTEVQQRLWEYYDGACPRPLQEAMTQHLAGCPGCQAALNQWTFLARKTFPKKPPLKAPPFLWTRVLVHIEAREAKEGATWWAQWRWLSRVAGVIALAVFLGTGVIVHRAGEGGAPLELLLRGGTNAEKAIRLTREHPPTPEEVTAWILGGPAWEEN